MSSAEAVVTEGEVHVIATGEPDMDPPTPLPTGTVTFLMSDVGDSTPRWEADPVGMADAMARHDELLATAIEDHGGARPVAQGEGDSIVAAFARASDAARAAVAAQIALNAEEWPAGGEVRVRMGLHTGEAHLVADGTYAGPDLNRCARIRDLGVGGQILMSRTTRDLVVTRPGVELGVRALGSYRLKGMDRPEVVHQLVHPELPDVTTPLRISAAETPTNLVEPPNPMIGRDEDLAELVALCDANGVLTITGAGGSGKTRIANALAHVRLGTSPDGVWWVDLGTLASPEQVVAEVFGVVGGIVPDSITDEAFTLFDRNLTLVLDNAEHLLDACADLVSNVRERAPRASVVVTSREPLGVPGEQAWRIPSLAVPDEEAPPEVVRASPAVELFVARATQVRPGYEMSDGDAENVALICRRLDGLPLAIELAAARIRMMSPSRIRDGLDDRFRLLTGGGRRGVARQQTLQSSIEWSHDLLDDDARRLLRRLAVFAGGFTMDAAERVVADHTLDAYAVFELVGSLVDKSLVVSAGDDRFHLLETVRQFAYDRLVTAGEVDAVRDAHIRWAVELAAAESVRLEGTDQHEALLTLDAEHDNLRSAFDWASATEDAAAVWSLVGSLSYYWLLRAHFGEAAATCARAEELAESVEVEPRLPGMWGAAQTAFYSGDYEHAFPRALEVVELAESVADQRWTARGLSVLGSLMIYADSIEARERLGRAAELADDSGDLWCRCDALQVLAYSHLIEDDFQPASATLEAVATLVHTQGNPQLLAWQLAGQSWIALRTGAVNRARSLANEAIAAAQGCGDPAVGGIATALLGGAAVVTGQAREVSAVLAESLETCFERRAGMAVPSLSSLLALCLVADGRAEEASAVIDDPAAVAVMTEHDRSVVQCNHRSIVAMARGDRAEARRLLETGIAGADASGWPVLAAGLEVRLAALEFDEGETNSPYERAISAIEVVRPMPMWEIVVDALHLLADVARAEDRRADAARLLGGAQGVLARAAAVQTTAMVALGAHAAVRRRDQLDSNELMVAWDEGASLGTDELLDWVLRARGSRGRPSLGWDSLTPTELRVAELTAEGLTNRQIGERLFVSAGTVKTHLAHIYAKLGVANRTAVATEHLRRTERQPTAAGPPTR